MLSDSMRDQLFDYLDGRLEDDACADFELRLQNEPELRAALDGLREWRRAGEDWEELTVPSWSRLRGVTSAGTVAGRSDLLSWASLAASTLAIVLVLAQVNLSISDAGVFLSFGKASPSQMEMEKHLAEFERRSIDYLNQRLALTEEKSRVMDRQLLAAALGYSRREWEEDMRLLTATWSRARVSDQLQLEELRDSQVDDRMAIQQLYTRLPVMR